MILGGRWIGLLIVLLFVVLLLAIDGMVILDVMTSWLFQFDNFSVVWNIISAIPPPEREREYSTSYLRRYCTIILIIEFSVEVTLNLTRPFLVGWLFGSTVSI